MPDYTDLELAKMEKQLNKIYKQAQSEIQEKWDKYMTKAQAKTHKAQNDYVNALINGDPSKAKKAKDQYEKVMLNMTLQNVHYQAMINQVTDKLADTNQIALSYLNDQMPKIYCHSFNEFAAEKIKGYSFELVSEQTVKNLIKDGNKSLLPQKTLNIPKDKKWNTKNINSQVLQGILQGESIDKISKRLQNVTDMNHNSAVRNARTMTTGAENKGRQDSFVKAKNDGIILKRRWVVAHDDRLRDWHAELDGVEVDVDEPFNNDYGQIMYPGDPDAHPANVYNCRCALRAVVKGFKPMEKPVGIYAQQYKDVSMSKQYYAMLDENKSLGNEFYKVLKAAGKPSEVWGQYILGTGNKTVAKNIDDVLAKYKGATKTVEKVVPKPDLSLYQGNSMTKTYKAIYAEDKKLAKSFWDVLQAEDNASAAWAQYLNGTAGKELTDKIDALLLKHKGTELSKVAAVPKVDKKLEKAKEELAIAQGKLESMGNKVYSGIWKYDDVTLADYEKIVDTIPAKKEWYMNSIKMYEEAGETAKALNLQKHLDDLLELESQGKIYAKYQTEYEAALKKVRDLTPIGERFGPEAYTEARKNAALWAKNDTEYSNLDKYYSKVAEKVKRKRTDIETQGYNHYTWGSGPFNSPLSGFKDGYNTTGKGYLGPGKVDINIDGYGDRIRGLTSLIEKSTYDQDFWVQSGHYQATLEGVLKIPYGSLSKMSETELQKFVGLEKEFPQFISGAIDRGGGSYVPGDMMFNIYCPSGSEALYVLSDGHFGKAEHEMILQRGGTYRITNIYRGKVNGREKLIVDMELHPEFGYNKFQQ